ncbi:TetR/AcrR family transcriptional regulator [Streptomyces sp. NBC_01481]|uniref:TetR/AcrR family transcriptional regulator n=1 Tax=Streptomyces sp. NBC_01481 TaxID=2975869 RepID=UPI002259B231|nr:TetR/AcrR family transcriptional regulator [Streptomyces sp. NBC_01481]MCX4587161.1 TetR/AcrR family transcriptional regulator [Streptomyces sp. NBC_01481]
MGRKPKFADEDFLDAAMRIAAERGAASVTMSAVAESAGAPVGSVYHRFASRDLLLARLWLRAVRRFQAVFLDAMSADDIDEAAEGAVLQALAWVRERPDEARVLLLHRREDLVARWPDELGPELSTLNDGAARALRAHARKRYGHESGEALERVTFALVDVVYAAVHRHLLAGAAPPPSIDPLAIAACRSVFAVPGKPAP